MYNSDCDEDSSNTVQEVISTKTFKSVVFSEPGIVVTNFYSPLCAPCIVSTENINPIISILNFSCPIPSFYLFLHLSV